MGKKCCVFGCKTNYVSKKVEVAVETKENDDNISVYRFPKDHAERERWINSIPNKSLKVNDDTVVCRLHWPEDAVMFKRYGKDRPKHPPSLFKGIPKSQLRTILPPLRTTQTSRRFSENTEEIDDMTMKDFLKNDLFTFNVLKDQLIDKKKPLPIPSTAFMSDNNLLIQSTCFVQGIPKFVLIISDSLLFETFHLGIKCYVSSLTANRVTKLDSWSKLEEAIRFLNLKEACNKTVILYQQNRKYGA